MYFLQLKRNKFRYCFLLLFLCLEGMSRASKTMESFLNVVDGGKLSSFIGRLQRTQTRVQRHEFLSHGLGSCEEWPGLGLLCRPVLS